MEGNVFEGRRVRNLISKSCNSKVTYRKIRSRFACKSNQKKSRKVTKAAEKQWKTELHQILLKYEMQAFQNTTTSTQQASQNVLPESQISSSFSSDSKAGCYTNLLLDENFKKY